MSWANTESVDVVDVTTKTSSVVRGGLISATYMDVARGVTVSPDGNCVFVPR